MKLLFQFCINILVFIFTQKINAAACCGGGFAAANIITNDDLAQLTTTYGWTDIVINQVDTTGVWHESDYNQTLETYKIDGSYIISDIFQIGLSLTAIEKKWDEQKYFGLGDTSLTIGYEYLPDWNYHVIRPKGIGYLQLIIPSGKSRLESEIGGIDSRGNGLWALGVGTIFTKSWIKWDWFANIEIHKSFNKSFKNSQLSGTLQPGYGGVLTTGLGYNTSKFRLGSQIAWTYEDAIETITNSNWSTKGSVERYSTLGVSLAYMKNSLWSTSISYLDQTLLGNPINTTLGKGFALQIQRKWAR